MSTIRIRLIKIISSRDVSLIFFSWLIKRLLDYLWEKGQPRLKFKGKTHFKQYLFMMFGVDLLMIILNLLLYIPNDAEVSEYREELKRFLPSHRKYHQLVEEPCCVCLNIICFSEHLQKYVPDSELYPPFRWQSAYLETLKNKEILRLQESLEKRGN